MQMTDYINCLIDDLYNTNRSLNDNIINILLYLKYFKDNKLNEKSSYKKSFQTYVKDILIFYNYQIHNLEIDEFDSLIDKYSQINESKSNVDYLKKILDNLMQKKELKQNMKELKNFNTNHNIVNYMLEIIKNDQSPNKKIINLFSGSGTFIRKAIEKKIDYHSLIGYDINDELNTIAKILIDLENDVDFTKQIYKNDLLKDEINIDKSNIIISDLPLDIKNLTHASCCSKIKQLKIRGTKSEPLIIQLITTLLAKNGKAIIFIPDSFLFSDSNQHVETRKLLLTNFCVEQVISVPEQKKSILVFSNRKQEKQIKLTDFNNTYDYILDVEKTYEKQYSLYYQNYYMEIPRQSLNNTYKFREIIEIYTNYQEKYTNQMVLVSYKNNTFKIVKYNENDVYQYIYISKRPDIYSQEFLNYHLFELFAKNLNYLTKGKCKSINTELILELNITVPDVKLQKNAIEYINLGSSVLIMLQQQQSELESMKNNLIESIITKKETKPLVDFCNIGHISNYKETIQINRNSNLAGQISLTTNESDNSTNMFYLTLNENMNKDYMNKDYMNKDLLFYLLKYNELELIKISNLGNTIQLPRGKLENLQIPILTEEDANNILKSKDIDEKIRKINQIYAQLISELTIGIF
jgi:hypothetical protein